MSDMVFVWAIGATVTWGFVTAYEHTVYGVEQAKKDAWLVAVVCACFWPLILGTGIGEAIGKLNLSLSPALEQRPLAQGDVGLQEQDDDFRKR